MDDLKPKLKLMLAESHSWFGKLLLVTGMF